MAERKLFADELETRLDELLFASPSHRSLSRLADALEALPRAQQELVLHWAGVAAQTNAEIGYLVCSLAPQALGFLDAEGIQAWVLAALDRYDKHGARPAMDYLRDIEARRAEFRGDSGARLTEVEARLACFVRGLSGRALALRPGEYAWTDTETLFLPPQLARLAAAADNRRLYQAIAAMLWAQTRYGTFNADLEGALAGYTAAGREAALAWLNVYEAIRLEANIGRELPGLARDIAALRGPWPPQLAAAVAVLSAPAASVADSLALLAAHPDAASPAPSFAHLGVIDPAAAGRVRTARIERDTQLLKRALAALRGVGGVGQPQPETAAASTPSDGVGELAGDIGALPPAAQAAAASLLQDLGALPPELLTPAGDGAWTPLPDAATVTSVEYHGTRPPDACYDEWDYKRAAHRRLWCHLYQHTVEPGDADYVAEVRSRLAGPIRQIRRRFESLRGEDRIHKRQAEGDEVDIDALVDARADHRAGAEPSTRLFARRQRSERSLAVMFMVDMSGSTKGWINDAEREALVMICEAIERLGDAYAIYGFSGWTRTRCDSYRIKDFADPYDETVQRRIAGIEAKDYTRMGVAIRHLGGLLAKQPARHKLLVTLSDGRPDDFGDEYRGTYGIEDTRRALQEVRQQGIRSYCVTIDRHGADYLKRLYGPAHYTVLADVKLLPLRIAEIYRKLTT